MKAVQFLPLLLLILGTIICDSQAKTLSQALHTVEDSSSGDHSASNSDSSSSSDSSASSAKSKSDSATASTSTASSSSSSSSSESEETPEAPRRAPKRRQNDAEMVSLECPKGMFSRNSECHPCSVCGPDLYARKQCTVTSDTACDWCLNPQPLQNRDFRLKCFDVIKVNRQLKEMIDRQVDSEGDTDSDRFLFVIGSDRASEKQQQIFSTEVREPVRFLSLQSSWKIEMLVEACFYLALIALIFAVIRYISKSKPHYRTVTIQPPVLDEIDAKNIIQAASHIRNKLGKKGYEKLEEFV